MLDFFKGKIYHKPDDIIPSECRQYLGDYEGGQVALAFEDGEFRVYNYEWWSYDSIVDGEHENEDWYTDCDNYFQGADGFLDRESCEYRTLKFENTNPVGMAQELLEACDDMLEDCYSITHNEGDGPNDKLINFIKEHSMNRVYCYYK